MSINKNGACRAGLLLTALLSILCQAASAAPQAPNFVGTWQMRMEGGRGGAGRGGNGSGGNGGNGAGRGATGRGGGQTLTIAQDGDAFKITHRTPRAEETADAMVSGNTISWTEMRQGRNGNSVTVDYKATVDGDTMTGTMSAGRQSRSFTAKRGS